MRNSTIFDERLALNMTDLNAVSDTLGPGRIGRCLQSNITIAWGPSCTAGVLEIQFSHSQLFPETPIVINVVPCPGPSQTHVEEIPSKYLGGFVRVKVTTAIDGNGVSIWAQGRR